MTLVTDLDRAIPKTGALLGVFGDNHIGIMDQAANHLMVECFEREGVTHVIANGDVHDCAAVSPHEMKAKRASLETGVLDEEIAEGRWLINWLTTRPTWLGTGNHDDWINDLAVKTNTIGTVTVKNALHIPSSIVVLPHGYQVRLGSLVIEHGDVILKGGGSTNLAQSILNKCPDQTTIVNHFHRMGAAYKTSPDRKGIARTRAAFPLGHMSDPTKHQDYAGRFPNWQQGFALVRVWFDGSTPRYTVMPVEIHRDRHNRPLLEHNGRVYR